MVEVSSGYIKDFEEFPAAAMKQTYGLIKLDDQIANNEICRNRTGVTLHYFAFDRESKLCKSMGLPVKDEFNRFLNICYVEKLGYVVVYFINEFFDIENITAKKRVDSVDFLLQIIDPSTRKMLLNVPTKFSMPWNFLSS